MDHFLLLKVHEFATKIYYKDENQIFHLHQVFEVHVVVHIHLNHQ
jgi:hypothetical protein